MEDLKRLLSPAIIALVLHGLLIGFKLPKQETLKPVLGGNLITIEINATSPPPVVPEKKEEPKKTESIPNAISQKKVVKKKVITQPAAIPEQHKKRNIEQRQQEKKVSRKEKSVAADLQHKRRENQAKNITTTETSPQEIRDKSILKETGAVAHAQNINSDLEGDPSKEKYSTSQIQKTAIPMYRQNKKPPYPAIAKLRGYEGVTLLSVLVSAEGMVAELRIKHSSGHLSLDNAALQTVKNWLFTQATEGGRHVAMWVDIPIKFELK